MTFLGHNEAAKPIIHWMFNGDTGVSSETMAAFALGTQRERAFGQDAPSDPSNIGRCDKLVMAVPEILDVFPVISRKAPVFRGISAHWDELCALYERDLSTGGSLQLFRRIQELREQKTRSSAL